MTAAAARHSAGRSSARPNQRSASDASASPTARKADQGSVGATEGDGLVDVLIGRRTTAVLRYAG